LRSEVWATIRKRVISQATVCAKCLKNKPSQVHHIDYTHEVLAGKDDSLLLAVCGGCHLKFEFKRGKTDEPLRARAVVNSRSLRARTKYRFSLLIGPRTRHGGFHSNPTADKTP
jgi:hypothetical protein